MMTDTAHTEIGPLPLTYRCDCKDWAASESIRDDIENGYRFECPDCHRAVREVVSDEDVSK